MKPDHRAVLVLVLLTAAVLVSAYQWKDIRSYSRRWLPIKFSKNFGLQTATQNYSVSGDALEPSPAENNGGAELPPLSQARKMFQIDDTERVAALQFSQTCVPKNFGYTIEAGNAVFPPSTYPHCSSKLPRDLPSILFNPPATAFSLTCPKSRSGKYVLHPHSLQPNGLYTLKELDKQWETVRYRGEETSLGAGEFVYAGCDDELTQMTYIPRLNETRYRRAKETMRDIGVTQRPLTIILLTIDSFSRRHFYRKLNHTVELLNDLNADERYSVFDFKLHNVHGGSSTENVLPIFGNRSYPELSNPPFRDLVGPGALWQILRDLGYVSLVGFESCDYVFPACTGKSIEVDHVVRSFYCASVSLFHRTTDKDEAEQRCLGSHMSHYYLLNYTHAFLQTYKGVNQFVSIHIDTAHEETGQHAATLDDDLRDFLKGYLQDSQDAGHDLVVFLQADHGMRYGNWFKDIAAHQEMKLPAFFIVTTSHFLDRIPNSRQTLWNNTFRLTSKMDIRASILGLARMPYGGEYPVHSDPYLNASFDLFREEVNKERTCADAGIDPWYCSCLLFERIDRTACSDEPDSLGRLIFLIADYSLSIINRETNTSPALPGGLLCQKLTLGYVRKSYGLNLANGLELLQIEFSVKEQSSIRFETLAVVGTQRNTDQMRLEPERYEVVPLVYNGYQVRMRVVGITRKDKYAGLCENVARSNRVKAEFCVCNDLDTLRRDAPALFADV